MRPIQPLTRPSSSRVRGDSGLGYQSRIGKKAMKRNQRDGVVDYASNRRRNGKGTKGGRRSGGNDECEEILVHGKDGGNDGSRHDAGRHIGMMMDHGCANPKRRRCVLHPRSRRDIEHVGPDIHTTMESSWRVDQHAAHTVSECGAFEQDENGNGNGGRRHHLVDRM